MLINEVLRSFYQEEGEPIVPSSPLKAGEVLEKISHLDFGLFFKACSQIFKNDQTLKKIVAGQVGEDMVNFFNNYIDSAPLACVFRLDIVVSSGRPYIVEIETMPGGRGVTSCAEEQLLGKSNLIEDYVSFLEREKLDDQKIIYGINNAFKGYESDCSYFVKRVKEKGINISLGNIEETGIPKGCFVDRFYYLPELNKQALATSRKKRNKQFLHPGLSFLGSKIWMAVLHDPTYEPYWVMYMGKDEFVKFKESVATTFLLHEGNSETVAYYPRNLIKKHLVKSGEMEKMISSETTSLNLGKSIGSKAWQESILALADNNGRPVANSWRGGKFGIPLVQEFNSSDKFSIEVKNGNVASYEGKARFSPFVFLNSDGTSIFHKGMATIRNSDIVHGASDAVSTCVL